MDAVVRINAAHVAIPLLPRFVKGAFRWAVGIADGITGWKRVFKPSDCTNIATAAIILSDALSWVDTNFYP